ncbi:MAG: aminopeptidase [Anaerolineales bacterium]|nr:MAG: aminopeptidase [Anaerolineales bacterium]
MSDNFHKGIFMATQPFFKLAQILVDHSTYVKPGDRVAIETTTNAVELVSHIYELVLQRGGHPHILLNLPDQDQVFFKFANPDQLAYTPTFQQLVTDQFEVYIRVRADIDPRCLSDVPAEKQSQRQKGMAPVRNRMLQRGADNSLRWVLTQFPTEGYAKEAGMSLPEYTQFLLAACHADENTPNPVAHWEFIRLQQSRMIESIEGHELIKLQGPNVDLSLSVKGRKFNNSFGRHNLPDGEIYTGPVEGSANGWVKFTYPAIYQGRVVEGVELEFKNGRVVSARAKVGEDLLKAMIDSDEGSHYLGEFAIGTNFEIDRFTRNILFDEKLGGTFHLALGAGYPETGSKNTSVIHWDMICDLRHDSEMLVDGTAIYRNGKFI